MIEQVVDRTDLYNQSPQPKKIQKKLINYLGVTISFYVINKKGESK